MTLISKLPSWITEESFSMPSMDTDAGLSPTPRNHRLRQSGFSLVEILVTIAVFSLTAGALFRAIASGTVLIQNARENIRANQILVEKMETIRLYTFDQMVTSGFIPTTFTAPLQPTVLGNTNSPGFVFSGQVTITIPPLSTSYVDDLRLVKIQLTWTSNSILHRRNVSTLVCKNGLQSYIY